ncbi:hypothetical protein RIVM261_042020 [Rivularia sp. IAM M-261]|nr:hypothetical protein RIVM261_042020 [Rivularia sp. IAM M-261]
MFCAYFAPNILGGAYPLDMSLFIAIDIYTDGLTYRALDNKHKLSNGNSCRSEIMPYTTAESYIV